MTAPKTQMRRWPAPRTFDSPIIGRSRPLTKALWPRKAAFTVVCVAGLLVAGCHRAAEDANAADSASPDQAASSQGAGYAKPPEIVSAARQGGAVVLSGRSDPNARIRLSSPDGNAYGATATASGVWTLAVPVGADMREFGLSEVLGEADSQDSRTIQGEGYVAALPGPGQAGVLLRAGGGSQTLEPPAAGVRVTAIDFDAGGGSAVSGAAKPGATVRLSVDGAAPIEAKADAHGRYTAPLAGVLKPGVHEAVAQSAEGTARAAFTVSPTPTITGLPYRAARQSAGWRIDWVTPGGAPQTTLALDPSAPASAAGGGR